MHAVQLYLHPNYRHNKKYIIAFEGSYHGRVLSSDLICGDSEISDIELSYAFKLILDEFKSLGLYPKLNLKTKY